MKKLILIFLVGLLGQAGLAQSKTPTIVAKLPLGESLQWKEYSVNFKRVTEDSRCPSDATCVWQGQAKVVLLLKKNGKIEAEKEIVVGPKNKDVSFRFGEKEIEIHNIAPYPTQATKANLDYYLQVNL